jgi:hypothetical protein
MDIHFGVEWFKNAHNFGVVGTGNRGVQISVKWGSNGDGSSIDTTYTTSSSKALRTDKMA